MWGFIGNRTSQQRTRTDAMTVDVELGNMRETVTAQTDHPLRVDTTDGQTQTTAAGPPSTSLYPPVPSLSTVHQRTSAKRSHEDEVPTKTTKFATAPHDLLQEKERQQIEAAVCKELADVYQKDFDNMRRGFDEQMATLRRDMGIHQQQNTITVQNLNNQLRLARQEATNYQGEFLESAAQVHKLRAVLTDNGLTLDANAGRTVIQTLQEENQQLQQEVVALHKIESPQQALVRYEAPATIPSDHAGIGAMEEDDETGVSGPSRRGIEDDDDADDESESQRGDDDEDESQHGDEDDVDVVDKGKRPIRLTGRRPSAYVEVSDEDRQDHDDGSDVEMEQGANASGLTSQVARKGKAPRLSSKNQVPRPQTFTRPRGGAGPMEDIRSNPLGGVPSPSSRNRGTSKRRDGSERDYRRKVGNAQEWHRRKGPGQNSGQDNAGEHATGQAPRPSKRLKVFSVVKLRGTDFERTKFLKHVEFLMNDLMEMDTYDNIIDAEIVDDEEANEFAKDLGNPPVLRPLRPYFGKRFKKHAWNGHLAALFIEYFEGKLKLKLSLDDQDKVAVMFIDRVERLRRRYRELMKEIPDDEKEAREQDRRMNGRRNTRRVNTFDVRRLICLESLLRPDGTEDPMWRLLLEMVLELGSYGMSSDESEVDEKGNIRYNIRKRLWRSRDATDRLQYIDGTRNTTNGMKRRLPGNILRECIRSLRNAASTRDPSVECPINFYDTGYLASLDNVHIRALNTKPSMDLAELRR